MKLQTLRLTKNQTNSRVYDAKTILRSFSFLTFEQKLTFHADNLLELLNTNSHTYTYTSTHTYILRTTKLNNNDDSGFLHDAQ